ncbi:probable inactive serine/threonine-protein kinase fnkC [Juglans microcarpa x Juglans regia]|uniref:probable inactive serine/threonine-protein kinase fnkC n=1 Tax=Juglans microcarpa x Juglans regia TaxID=2249226 RepID=UPI001B7E6E97|nr:probable inactive serine/threonine-protein kinase fnkC [Juglans microcarpa x Juglans regia]XP_041001381.1 probable inactive serine/threonine-protein kinase fnkC [Juglans microcarpa x Juglans regia]
MTMHAGEQRSVQKENMEYLDKACHSLPADIDTNGVVRSSRDFPPAHYTFQIKNFSVLFEAEVGKCESGQFELGGYKWKLVLKTNGKKNSKSHISLYLAIENKNTLSLGWEANVNFRFFVFDQIRNMYLCIQDADGRVRRFHNLKTEWGFAQLLSHDTLNDPSNGYIVDDSCILGAEVFVIKGTGRGVCLSMIKQPQINYFTWRVDSFDARKDYYYLSNVFVVEGRKWKLKLYPRGADKATSDYGFSLSLYLQPVDDSEIVTPNRKLYAKYKLRIRDQVNSNHLEKTLEYWFSSSNVGFGAPTFTFLTDLKDPSNGYLVDDALLVECKIDVISEVKDFSG